MVPQRKRRLFLGLGLVVALALAVSPATASAVSGLEFETLSGSSSSGNTAGGCFGTSTFSVTGTATAPYPGTFTETGTFGRFFNSGPSVSATFTITSGTTTITGSKNPPPGGQSQTGCGNDGSTNATVRLEPYTATIHTPDGAFRDEGVTFVDVSINSTGGATLTEIFDSTLVTPTNKDQCKNNGWKAFPQFKNQGECVSFVERRPRT